MEGFVKSGHIILDTCVEESSFTKHERYAQLCSMKVEKITECQKKIITSYNGKLDSNYRMRIWNSFRDQVMLPPFTSGS